MSHVSKKSNLTDSQLVILSAAAGRNDGAVLPPPPSLTLNRGALAKVIGSLLKGGHIAERQAALGEEVWRSDDDVRVTLVITASGRQAIGIEDEAQDGRSLEIGAALVPTSLPTGLQPASPSSLSIPPHTPPSPLPCKSAPKTSSKLGLLMDLVARPDGATVSDLMTATGWQAHSVRGAISGSLKKKLGLRITSEPVAERGRVYRIAGDEAAQ